MCFYLFIVIVSAKITDYFILIGIWLKKVGILDVIDSLFKKDDARKILGILRSRLVRTHCPLVPNT